MGKKRNKKIKKITLIRPSENGKTLRYFLTSEEGRITKKKAAKLAMFLIAAAAATSGLIKAEDVNASCAHNNHNSHASHENGHANGGWC